MSIGSCKCCGGEAFGNDSDVWEQAGEQVCQHKNIETCIESLNEKLERVLKTEQTCLKVLRAINIHQIMQMTGCTYKDAQLSLQGMEMSGNWAGLPWMEELK